LKDQNVLEKYESFFKGGFWRNFLAKYPEVNNMHKKMLRVSDRFHSLPKGTRTASRTRAAGRISDFVLSAQCNDPYWHGVFGGLYLPNLRYPIYRNLLSAERELDTLDHLNSFRVENVDFDTDGSKEILIESRDVNYYFKPDLGGMLFELDFKPALVNLLDIVSRREEGYHRKLAYARNGEGQKGEIESIHDIVVAKEAGLENHLNYDWYRRGSLIDHFFGPETTLESLSQSRYPEVGDFVSSAYEATVKKSGRSLQAVFSRDGSIRAGDRSHRIRLRKKVLLNSRDTRMSVEYTFVNLEPDPISLWFGCEFNIGLQAGDAHDRYYYLGEGSLVDARLRSKGEIEGVSTIGLRDEWLGVDVQLTADNPTLIFRHPIETISLSEAGFERIYQSSVVIPTWKFVLEQKRTIRIEHAITELKRHKAQGRKK
jgi:alpha-amylase